MTLKGTNKTYDVWYLYDENNSAVGFMYYQLINIGSNEHLSLGRYYYEKDLQGNIIGILDAHGYEVVTYSYDAWGNITDTTYTSQIPYQLNHLTYRGYYRDEETGFYYLQSRYYDAEVGRFINADDVSILTVKESSVYKDNLYCYCNSNPVNNVDPTGRWLANLLCGAISAAVFALLANTVCNICGVSGGTKAGVVIACGLLGGIIGGVLGPKFLAKHAPNLMKALKQIEKRRLSIKNISNLKSGNIFGIVISDTLIIMLHTPHAKYKEWYFHIQVEVKLGKHNQFVIWKKPILNVKPDVKKWR